jgi:hypothetical protein
MQKIAIGLSALLLIATRTTPGTAQDASTEGTARPQVECAEYFGCLHYGILTEAQARTARGHPQFKEPRPETTPSASKLSATPDRGLQASRIVAPSHQ